MVFQRTLTPLEQELLQRQQLRSSRRNLLITEAGRTADRRSREQVAQLGREQQNIQFLSQIREGREARAQAERLFNIGEVAKSTREEAQQEFQRGERIGGEQFAGEQATQRQEFQTGIEAGRISRESERETRGREFQVSERKAGEKFARETFGEKVRVGIEAEKRGEARQIRGEERGLSAQEKQVERAREDAERSAGRDLLMSGALVSGSNAEAKLIAAMNDPNGNRQSLMDAVNIAARQAGETQAGRVERDEDIRGRQIAIQEITGLAGVGVDPTILDGLPDNVKAALKEKLDLAEEDRQRAVDKAVKKGTPSGFFRIGLPPPLRSLLAKGAVLEMIEGSDLEDVVIAPNKAEQAKMIAGFGEGVTLRDQYVAVRNAEKDAIENKDIKLVRLLRKKMDSLSASLVSLLSKSE